MIKIDVNKFIKKAQEGDRESHEAIIIQYDKLIRKILSKYININDTDYDDYLQEGRLALFKAINNFDLKKEVKFITYAYICVEKSILTYIRKTKNIVKYARRIQEISTEVKKMHSDGCNEIEICEKLNVELKDVLEALDFINGTKSIEEEIEKNVKIMDKIVSEDKGYSEIEIYNDVKGMLTEEEWKCFNHIYIEERTQTETSIIMGTYQAQISRLIKAINNKCRIGLKETV